MKILVCVPFHSGDSASAAAMLDWVADLSGQQDRTVVLAREEHVDTREVVRAASRAFRTVEHLTVTACAQGWPISANCYFACIAFAMRGRAPWLLLEHDCTLTAVDGLDRLGSDYERSGKPNLGAIIPAFFNKNGTWTENGKMLAGVAIYHPNLWDHSPLLQSLQRVQADYAAYAKKTGKPVQPKAFDCYLAPDILPHSAATPLIQHMGRSTEFRLEGGRIVCTYPAGSRWDPVVSREAVLVHGCKDGSLIALLREELKIAPGSRGPAPVATIIPAAPPKRRETSGAAVWQDERPKEAPHAPAPSAPAERSPASNGPRPPARNTSNNEAVATLGDARNAIEHWPGCKAAIFSLQARNDRFRVVCECGANSPKLPDGPDWEEIWREAAGRVVPTVNPAYATATHELGPSGFPEPRNIAAESAPTAEGLCTAYERLIAENNSQPASLKTLVDFRGSDVAHTKDIELETLETPDRLCSVSPRNPEHYDAAEFEIGVVKSSTVPELKPGDRILYSRVMPAIECLEPIPKVGRSKFGKPIVPRKRAPKDLPLQDLKCAVDVLARFPEWKDLTPKERNRRLKMAKLKERRQTAKAKNRQIEDDTAERLLTVEARARKLALLEVCKGKQGAFIKLRRIAETVGITGTKRYKKDQLITAILKREFANPYEELEERA